MSATITILMPVYGRPALFEQALASVLAQTSPDWQLLIADDGSDASTVALIQRHQVDRRIRVVRRSHNLGLFANLNQATQGIDTPYQLILCSDDLLEPDAILYLHTLLTAYPACELVLSSYRSIDASGVERFDVNGLNYDLFAPITQEFAPQTLLPTLLRLGSINGNITGMLIRNSLFDRTGPWRQEWSQAADWDWLIRASEQTSVLINRQPIARVRVHAEQLSVSNRRHQREGAEIAGVLTSLINHPALRDHPQRRRWAAHHAQFLLWNALKAAPQVGVEATIRQLALLHQSVGLRATAQALIASLPDRLRIRGSDRPLPPPPA